MYVAAVTETVSVGFPGNSADSATAVIGANFRLMYVDINSTLYSTLSGNTENKTWKYS